MAGYDFTFTMSLVASYGAGNTMSFYVRTHTEHTGVRVSELLLTAGQLSCRGFAGWLVGWSVGWLVGWSVGCSDVWSVGWLYVWSVGRMAGWLVGWSVGRSVGCLVGRSVGLLIGCLVVDRLVNRSDVWSVGLSVGRSATKSVC